MRVTIRSRCDRAIKVLYDNSKWILELGFWNDNWFWDDDENWID